MKHTQRILRAIALAVLPAMMASAAHAQELVRTAVSGGVAASTDGTIVLHGTVAEVGIIGVAAGDGDALIVGFWFPPLAALDIDAPAGPLIPLVPEVRRPSPNPFRAVTLIPYGVSAPGPVSMRVYDVNGRNVRTLVDDEHLAGWFTASWDGRDTAGRPAGNGVYYVNTRIGSFRSTTKVIVTR